MRVEATTYRRYREVLLIAGLVLAGAALRFWRLGEWNFEATEMFTLRDSVDTPRLSNARPLIYFLNHYLVGTFLPLDEFGLRLLPALFGILAIPAVYAVTRRLAGGNAALFAALLLTFSPLHVYYSQLARYWSAVFLFSAIYPFALYHAAREHNGKALLVGIGAAVLAILAHPVAVLLLGGPLLWLGADVLRPSRLRSLWQHAAFRWGLALTALLGVAVVIRMIPVLRGWISMHDRNPGTTQFLWHLPGTPGVKQALYVSAFVESLTLPLVLAAAAGVWLVYQRGDRVLALFLATLALFPLAFLTLISLRTPVSHYYLLPTVPVFFVAAGVFLDRLAGAAPALRPRWLLPASLTAIILAAGLPTLLSHYRDARRYDYRSVARWMEERVAPEDVVFSDQPMVLAHYLGKRPVERLRDLGTLTRTLEELPSGGRSRLWVVLPARSHAFRSSPGVGRLSRWLYDHCRIRNTVGVGRMDFRQHYLHVFRCPTADDPEPVRASAE